jgi:type IV pilus assembly protein PilQ
MKNPKEKRIMMKWRAWGTALVLAIGAPAAALAQGVIQSITSSQQAGADVVRVELSEALSAPAVSFRHHRA